MDFARLAIIQFSPRPVKHKAFSITLGDVTVKSLNPLTFDGKENPERLSLLVAARLPLSKKPDEDESGCFVIEDDVRKQSEAKIEAVASLISVAEKCERRISSPTPSTALIPEDEQERDYLTKAQDLPSSNGVSGLIRGIFLDDSKLSLADPEVSDALVDRIDGVLLLSEANTSNTAGGKFHDLERLFERAFRLSTEKLIDPLHGFLSGSPHNFTLEEVKSWVVGLRHPATHADIRDDFTTERDLLPAVYRMEEAAYDVLFNKVSWRNPSIERRAVWRPTGCTTDPKCSEILMQQGTGGSIRYQTVDPFGTFPLCLAGTREEFLPDGWLDVPLSFVAS